MAAARHNRPTIIVYGGTILPGVAPRDCAALNRKAGDPLHAQDGFEAYGSLHGLSHVALAYCFETPFQKALLL